MDYKLLDEIITKYCNEIGLFKDTVDEVFQMAKQVIKKELPEIDNNSFSKNIELSDSKEIVGEFFKNIDLNLAKEYNKYIDDPEIVKFEMKIENESDYVDNEGIVHIFYENTPNDLFKICHELLHRINYQERTRVTERENITRDYFGEAVSILGEMILGEYLVENEIINENDFNIRKRERLKNDKENARDVIIEGSLIQLKKENKEINEENINKIIDGCNDEDLKRVLLDEKHDQRREKSILNKYDDYNNHKREFLDVLNLRKSQRYVIAEYLIDAYKQNNHLYGAFIRLNQKVSNKDSKIDEVIDDIKKQL